MKASPSLKGVVIDKKLFSRVIKNRSSQLADKALLPKIDDEFESKVADLKRILVKKLMTLTEGKVSQGVKDYLGAEVIAKGSKFSASDFDSLDFTSIQLSNWTLQTYREKGLLPFSRIRHKIFYKPEDVGKLLQSSHYPNTAAL